jgi:D-glucosaminate-6-phosphate ammonia-lyase
MPDRVAGRLADARGTRDYLSDLGVRPIINAAGSYTAFCGNLMPPEVVQALAAMSGVYVRLDELHDAAGARIASLLGCEAAMVTSGAFGGLMLGTAACMTGDDLALIRRLPDTAGMKDEVIVQTSHRFPYDHAVRNCGVRLIEVETRAELEQAITERTAMLLFLNKAEPRGQITAAEFVRIGRARGVPTLNDAAADVPPVDTLVRLPRVGFDLVTFSGGKGLQGPQSAGLLLGRRDLIRAARLNTGPHSDTVGRGLKVGKEEIVAMMVAVERYLSRDHEADWREWEARVRVIREALAAVPGVSTERFVPAIANEVPHVRIRWDRTVVAIDRADVVRRLRDGEPSIETVPVPYEEGSLEVASWTLRPGEAEIVARRIREILGGVA